MNLFKYNNTETLFYPSSKITGDENGRFYQILTAVTAVLINL